MDEDDLEMLADPRPPYMAIWELKAAASGVLIAVGIVGFLVVMWLMLRGQK